MYFRVDPDPERDTRPRDTYDVIDGDTYDHIVGNLTHAEAAFTAAVLNGEVTADDLRAEGAAKALREAADAQDADPEFRDPLRLKSDWLRARADRIEARDA